MKAFAAIAALACVTAAQDAKCDSFFSQMNVAGIDCNLDKGCGFIEKREDLNNSEKILLEYYDKEMWNN